MVGMVLLVEDVRFTRAMTRRMIMSALPCEVHEAADGEEALATLKQINHIDLVVADISMPGMNGLELLKTIRTGRAAVARDIPVIIISGTINHAVRWALENLTVSAIISKPARRDELASHLNQLSQNIVERAAALRSVADYEQVDIAGLLRPDALAISPEFGHFDEFDDRVRFLETVPALEGLDADSVRLLAELAEILQFQANTEIGPAEYSNSRLLLIARGEAEVVRRTVSRQGGAKEHRINLLEAGNLLGMTAFMSLPDEAEHSLIRTTRPTEVLALDFSAAGNDPELMRVRDKVKLSVGRTLALRLTHSDEAIAENLSERLAAAQVKQTAGRFVIMLVCYLAMYTLSMRLLLDLDLMATSYGVALAVMFVVAFLPFLINVRTGPFSFAELGMTLKGAGPALVEAIGLSLVFLAALAALKFLLVTVAPDYQGYAIFDFARNSVRPEPAGAMDTQFHLINFVALALFAPIQEVIVRCGLQSLIWRFLSGTDGHRAIIAILASNLLFAAAHTHLDIPFALAIFVGGLFWGWLFHRRRSIVGVAVSHILIAGVAVFGLGLEFFL
ncbi:MAG: response regulator [Rhodospirillaceae bacterium]|nr:response regulator [Rhodospirillaceae bacterium]MBT4491145.1 response regulator [Rhodospirillaceae bacterium]MBT5192645.1 response regulator [Rhodospirillaceae bacterium]MBT5894661.1 response regulator [Rhodospirillaceae bacterium]MBT6426538.1 response regulator [Rhodospirillaceae bacterium]